MGSTSDRQNGSIAIIIFKNLADFMRYSSITTQLFIVLT